MRRPILLALALMLLPLAAARAEAIDAAIPAGGYGLDPARASLVVRIPYMGGLSRYLLRFRRLAGSADYDPGRRPAALVEIVVDPRSVRAQDRMLDRAALRTFEPERYPEIRFTSTTLTPTENGRARLTGELRLHGVTRPLSLDITLRGSPAAGRLGFSGVGKVRRSDFGLARGWPFAADVVDLVFDVEFVRR